MADGAHREPLGGKGEALALSCSGVEWFDVVRVVSGVLGVGVGVEETFKQVPILLGKQLEQGFPAFTQAQPLHEPVLLHLQQATIFPITVYFTMF